MKNPPSAIASLAVLPDLAGFHPVTALRNRFKFRMGAEGDDLRTRRREEGLGWERYSF